MDTPEHLIEKEWKWNNPHNIEYEKFSQRYLFNNVEDKFRIKTFNIKYDKEVIDTIYERVDSCREYINNINQ